MRKMVTGAIGVTIAAVVSGAAGAAEPQAAQAAPVGDAVASQSISDSDIIVTARKREERLLDVPISIQAFSSEELKSSGTYDLQDLRLKSGFTFPKALGTGPAGRAFGTLTFRGLQGEGGQFFEASGALFIDGIFVSGGQASVNTVDAERVEVLKGPQNAFFGRSTFGGAINIITKRPSEKFSVSIDARATARGSYDVDATAEGAIIPGLVSARLTGNSHRKASYYTASDGGELGEETSRSISGTLYITPTDKMWLRLRGYYQFDDDSAAALGYLPGQSVNSCVGKSFTGGLDRNLKPVTYSPNRPFICGAVPSLKQTGPQIINANTDVPALLVAPLTRNSLNAPYLSDAPGLDHSGFQRETLRLSAQAGIDLPGNMNLAVNAGYNNVDGVALYDQDRSSAKNYYNIIPVLTEDVTLDARLTTDPARRLRMLLGASYFSSKYQSSQIDYNPALIVFGAAAVGPVNSANFSNIHARVPAVYGSIDFDPIDKVTLSLEGRYQQDTSIAYSKVGVRYQNRTREFLPRFTVKVSPTADSNIYASYAEGVQPLTLNNGYIIAPTAGARAYISAFLGGATEFSPVPRLKTYEVGAKQKLFGGRVEYTLAAYYTKWKNRITSAFLFNPDNGGACPSSLALTPACPLPFAGLSVTVPNDVTVKGIEFGSTVHLARGWEASIYADYHDAQIPRYYNPGVQATLGANTTAGGNGTIYYLDRTVGKSPDFTGSFTTSYRSQLSNGWTGYSRLDVNYVGQQWESDYNFAKLNDYFRVNLRAGLQIQGTTVELFVTNLFDDKNWDSGYRLADLLNTPTTFLGQGLGLVPPDRREFGIRVARSF